ncbi:MAG: hypothetical protein ABF287_02020 [Pacificibacter sp.]
MIAAHTYQFASQQTAQNTQECVLSATVLRGVRGLPCADVSEVAARPVRAVTGEMVNKSSDFATVNMAAKTDRGFAILSKSNATQMAQVRANGFTQNLRTNVSQEAGIWRADAVYSNTSAPLDGLRTLDTKVIVSNGREFRIPTV